MLRGTLALREARDGAVGLCYSTAMGPVQSDHGRLDERNLALLRLIAAKVRADPALLDKARETPAPMARGRRQPEDGTCRVGTGPWRPR